KFTPEGIFQWVTYKGGQEDDHFRNCIADDLGNIYLAGYTESSSDIATADAFQTIYAGEGDCMVAKYSPEGNLIWCTYLGALGQDRFHAVNLDLFGHVLTQGTTGSTSGITTVGVHQEVYGGGEEDVLLAVFDTSGQRIWSSYYGGEYSDRGRGVEPDSMGNIYIGGLTESEIGIATLGAHQEQWTEGYYNGNVRAEDGYLAKFTPDGQLTWGTYYGGEGYDRIWGICLDPYSKFIYTAGGTQSEDSVATSGAWQPIIGGGTDGFFAKWDYDGNLIWGSYLGANSEEHLEDIDVDSAGFIYLLGETDKNRIPVTVGVHQIESNGSDEATLHKFYAGLECFDYNEPNDSFGSAILITSWLPSDSLIFGYSGNIVNSNDQDWFQIEVTIDQPDLMFALSALTQNYSLNLFNAQQMLLATSSQFGTLDTLIANNLLAGTYYISIAHDSASFDSINCYILKAFKSATDFATQADNGISSNGTSEFITIFPNPASEVLSFSLMPSLSSNATLVVYDLLGRIKKSEMIHLKQGYQIIDLQIQDLPSGIYNIVVKSNSNTWKATFIR
ncbi:MAG: T9SS type A sorting domain-containing protein, partial [Chitinophagales bacterium]|nr:T9SS type A sorting domain-containing protein [Chitinophagales bacterium]